MSKIYNHIRFLNRKTNKKKIISDKQKTDKNGKPNNKLPDWPNHARDQLNHSKQLQMQGKDLIED